MLFVSYMRLSDKTFDFKLRRDHRKKKSYEHRAYESVDEKSLSLAMFRKATKKRIDAFKN